MTRRQVLFLVVATPWTLLVFVLFGWLLFRPPVVLHEVLPTATGTVRVIPTEPLVVTFAIEPHALVTPSSTPTAPPSETLRAIPESRTTIQPTATMVLSPTATIIPSAPRALSPATPISSTTAVSPKAARILSTATTPLRSNLVPDDREIGKDAIHIVSVWAHQSRLVLAQRMVDTK